jgi:hypothetical protein
MTQPRYLVTAVLQIGGMTHHSFKVTDAGNAAATGARLAADLGGTPRITLEPYAPKLRRRKPSYRRGGRRDDLRARAAVDYARWLGVQNNLELHGTEPQLRIAFTKITRDGREIDDLRVRAVLFDNCSILIPCWSFTPAEPVEEIVEGE